MKPLLFLAAVSALPLAAACTPQAKAPRVALDCPATQGELTRTAMAQDGKSCIYASAEGAEVTLRLIPVSGTAFATLDRLEETLLAESAKAAEAAEAAAPQADTRPSPQSAAEAERAAAEAAKDAGAAAQVADAGDAAEEGMGSVDGVDVRLEKGKVVVEDGRETTRIDLPGIQIVADEANDSAQIRIGPLHVDASGEEAKVQIRREVRLKGEALAREKRGVRATFISSGKSAADGRRFVGYEAGGPKTGPLTVAIVHSKSALDDDDNVYRDIKKLVRKNGGV
ncbi:conserved hypothetical protein [Phenylobacterium zucineum HLK1]|uniref:Methyltransferase type 11 n=1 Tax=Phenylobacterium zucineum (strain HLK1) TaxID=450851 RepID=B4R9M8_PHEZH|nr:hypothetical protein [Phenylobacterium zucineum]ACG77792.1 conserved hypothetical protein [Phenylobacterium zucineum HLK1]